MSEETIDGISISKCDLAIDLRGGFLPTDTWPAYQRIKERISQVLPEVLGSTKTNFVSHKTLRGIKVLNGKNCLASCFQYEARDDEGAEILTIKVYDKILDFVSREHQHTVGSRVCEIIGSKRHVNALNRRVCQSQNSGVTRLEVSLKEAVFRKYCPMEPSTKTLWH